MRDTLVTALLEQPANSPCRFRTILFDLDSGEVYAPICHLNGDEQTRLLIEHEEQLLTIGDIHFARLDWLMVHMPQANKAWKSISRQLVSIIQKQFFAR
jgi:hypothetical protein